MTRAWRWRAWFYLALVLLATTGQAATIKPRQAAFIVAADVEPPAAADPRWRATALPDEREGSVVWYRIEFDRPDVAHDEPLGLYLPYLYGGGKVWLNGEPVATVQEANAIVWVQWQRPQLLPLPAQGLRAGRNALELRIPRAVGAGRTFMPPPVIGSEDGLQSTFDARLFWARTVPFVTVIAASAAGLFFLLVWWRRRSEVLYGLFGLAALLWGVRTNTLVFDTVPAFWWPWWRLAYHVSTGGFVIVMGLFALALAGWHRPRIAAALAAYWLAGPLVFLLGASRGDYLLDRYWTAGLIPIGVGTFIVSVAAAYRQRSEATIALAIAITLAVATGIYDYLVHWSSPWIHALAPEWSEQRVFLLHHGANVLLIVMFALLSSRFVRTLNNVEEMNRTLEARVTEREHEIGNSYARIAELQREQAATEERQRIMQDLHDGLGSQLLISLLKVERGVLAPAGVAEMLRVCIADMRLAIEALASDDTDFRTALGNFLFRWETQLRDAGISSTWQIDAPDMVMAISPHTALQVLRVLQEALTNVIKHAQATHVSVRLTQTSEVIRLDIEDNGRGFAEPAASRGRGLANMRARAVRLGARLEMRAQPGSTCITLALPAASS